MAGDGSLRLLARGGDRSQDRRIGPPEHAQQARLLVACVAGDAGLL
jgi:hypothetical protein